MVTVKGNTAYFRFFRPDARSVELTGDFNEWRTGEVRMKSDPDGYWKASLRLPEGSYRFRYFADGRWYVDYAAFGLACGPFGPDGVVRIPASHVSHS